MSNTGMLLNQLSATNFVMDIPDNDYTKDLKLQIQGVTLPGMNIPITTAALNPLIQAHLPGSGFEFDPLIVRIAVDEELRSYIGAYKWMLGTVDYVKSESLRWLEREQTVSIHILDNSTSKVIATFHFYGAWPSNLGELELMFTNDTDEVVTCMLTLNFKYLEVELDGKIIRPEPRKKP